KTHLLATKMEFREDIAGQGTEQNMGRDIQEHHFQTHGKGTAQIAIHPGIHVIAHMQMRGNPGKRSLKHFRLVLKRGGEHPEHWTYHQQRKNTHHYQQEEILWFDVHPAFRSYFCRSYHAIAFLSLLRRSPLLSSGSR